MADRYELLSVATSQCCMKQGDEYQDLMVVVRARDMDDGPQVLVSVTRTTEIGRDGAADTRTVAGRSLHAAIDAAKEAATGLVPMSVLTHALIGAVLEAMPRYWSRWGREDECADCSSGIPSD